MPGGERGAPPLPLSNTGRVLFAHSWHLENFVMRVVPAGRPASRPAVAGGAMPFSPPDAQTDGSVGSPGIVVKNNTRVCVGF